LLTDQTSADRGVRGLIVAALVLVLGLTGCSTTSTSLPEAPADPPPATIGPQFPEGMAIECGPVADRPLCEIAVAVALTGQLNPPPAASVAIRLPRADDDCLTWFHACGAGSVIAVIQSGDTLQDVPLIRTADGWVRLDLVR